MQLIRCPWCGPREEVEFHYGAEARVAYPEEPSTLTDSQWAEFVFYRADPAGELTEQWCHAAGCRRWFEAVRDTRSYRFTSVRPGTADTSDTSDTEKRR
jgi:sarcosine oxidase subunit delta